MSTSPNFADVRLDDCLAEVQIDPPLEPSILPYLRFFVRGLNYYLSHWYDPYLPSGLGLSGRDAMLLRDAAELSFHIVDTFKSPQLDAAVLAPHFGYPIHGDDDDAEFRWPVWLYPYIDFCFEAEFWCDFYPIPRSRVRFVYQLRHIMPSLMYVFTLARQHGARVIAAYLSGPRQDAFKVLGRVVSSYVSQVLGVLDSMDALPDDGVVRVDQLCGQLATSNRDNPQYIPYHHALGVGVAEYMGKEKHE